MMYGMRNALVLAALIASAAPAVADWEGTQWGMSPGDALAVLDGATSHSPTAAETFLYNDVAYEPLVKLTHTRDGVAGEASLLFDAGEKLHFVAFIPDDLAQCDALTAAVTEVYGVVESSGFGSTAIYNWMDEDTVIRLTNAPDIGICNLSYGAS